MNIFKRLFSKKPKKEPNKHRGVPPMNGTWKNDKLTLHFGVHNYQASSKGGAAEGIYDWTTDKIIWKTCRLFPGFNHDVFHQDVSYKLENDKLLLSYSDKLISLKKHEVL